VGNAQPSEGEREISAARIRVAPICAGCVALSLSPSEGSEGERVGERGPFARGRPISMAVLPGPLPMEWGEGELPRSRKAIHLVRKTEGDGSSPSPHGMAMEWGEGRGEGLVQLHQNI